MFCSQCGAQVAENAAFCPACGKSASGAGTAAIQNDAGLTDNVAGMLAYVTIIPAIIFLLVEPFNRRTFVRFHAFQCLFLAVVGVVLSVIDRILLMIPVFGLMMLFVMPFVWLGLLVLAVVCAIKAYQGKMWKLPIIGDLAEKQATAANPAAPSSGAKAA